MATILVKPGDGRLVRLTPGAKPMKATGATVERTLLIEKWLRSGDLVEVVTAVEPVAAKGTKTVGAPSGEVDQGLKS